MDKNDGSSDQHARIREHVRTVLRKLSALKLASREGVPDPKASDQEERMEHIKIDREDHGS